MVALYQGFITQKLVEPDIDPRGFGEVLQALFGGNFWLGAAAGEVEPPDAARAREEAAPLPA
jgi:hypothetical protein